MIKSWRLVCKACVVIACAFILSSTAHAQIFLDTVHFDDFNLQHDAGWQLDSNKGLISDNNGIGQQIQYNFWGFAVDVWTFEDAHHGAYIVELDGVVDTVSVKKATRKLKRTWYKHWLYYGNHVLKIRPLGSGTFIFNKIVTYIDSSPSPPPYHSGEVVFKIMYDTLEVEVIREVQVPVEVIKEVPVEVIKQVQVIKWQTDTLYVDKIVQVPVEIIKWQTDTIYNEVQVPFPVEKIVYADTCNCAKKDTVLIKVIY